MGDTSSRAYLCCAVAVLSLGFVSCGGDEGSDGDATADLKQIHAVLADYGEAIGMKDAATGCALSATVLQRRVARTLGGEEGTCEAGFKTLTSADLQEDLDPRILDERVEGDRAFVVGWSSVAKDRQTAQLLKEDGEWKLLEWFRSKQ